MNKIVIIGGGLAGLTAAYILKNRAPHLDVTVLEARDQAGGKMRTTSFGGELGGDVIGFKYPGIDQLNEMLHLNMDYTTLSGMSKALKFSYFFPTPPVFVRSDRFDEWDQNPLTGELKSTPLFFMMLYAFSHIDPYFKWQSHLFRKGPFIKKIPAIFHLLICQLKNDPYCRFHENPELFQRLQNQSMSSFLRSCAIPQIADAFIGKDLETNENLERISALHCYLKKTISKNFDKRKFYFYPEGNSSLVKALSAEIKTLKCERPVVKIVRDKDANGYLVISKSKESFFANKIVFAIPSPLLQELDIEPELTKRRREALKTVHYTPALKCFFKLDIEKWKPDPFPLMTVSFGEIDSIFPIYELSSRKNPFEGERLWGILVGIYGETYRKLKEKLQGQQEIMSYLLRYVEKIRPSFKGLLTSVVCKDWAEDPFAKGGFHFTSPHPHLYALTQELSKSIGDFHFCGDYTEYRSKGFQAAIASGFRVAEELLSQYQ